MIKAGNECKSTDEKLGEFETVWECAYACREKSGCNYFVFGTGTKAGRCYWEKTKSRQCQEGLKSNQYDFYEMISMLDTKQIISGKRYSSEVLNQLYICFLFSDVWTLDEYTIAQAKALKSSPTAIATTTASQGKIT